MLEVKSTSDTARGDSVTLVESAKVLERVLPSIYPQVVPFFELEFPKDDTFVETLLKYEVSERSPSSSGAADGCRPQIVRELEFVGHQIQ